VAVDRNSAALKTQARTAQVAAGATLSMVKADDLLADAERVLSGEAEKTARQLRQQGRAAEEAAAKNKLAADAAKGGAGGFAALQTPMAGAIAAGVALAPVAVTLAAGLGGLGLAAYGTVRPILAASQATGGLKANLSTLSPVQQQMGRELLGLEGTASAFSKSLQPEVVKLWGDGIGLASGALRELQPVAKATGDALHGVLVQGGSQLSGEWKSFFQFMAAQAGPDLQLVGQLLIDLAKDVPPLLMQLQPLARLILVVADVALKAVGGLERMHLVLPLLGAAIGFVVGGPLGALAGAFAGLAIQEFAAAEATKQVAVQFEAVAKVKIPSASAAAVDWTAVAASLKTTAVSTTDVKNAMIDAHPAVGTIRGDLDLLGTSTTTATVALQAYSDLWNQFVGKAVSDQQAVLNVTQAFESFNSTVKASGRGATVTQQAFLSIFSAIGTGLDTLHKNNASVDQLNSFYQTNIARLNALHGLTPTQRSDVQGLTRDYQAWADKMNGLSGNTVKAAGVLRDNFLSAMSLTHQLVPVAKADADAFAAAVYKTGTNSRATASDRQRLINDLIHSGLSAAQAKADVVRFQQQVDALHGKSVNAELTIGGDGTVKIVGTGLATRTITASGQVRAVGGHTIAKGWLLSGGVPGVDSIPLLGMAGELVVPKPIVDAGEVDHLRGRIPGFAAGGIVGQVTAGQKTMSIAEAQWGQLAVSAFAEAALQAAAKTAAAAAAGGGTFLGAGSANYAADITTVLNSLGLPLSLTGNWMSQIATESGGNLRAVNLTDSNAQAGHPSVGLLQLIPATFANFAGPYRNTPPLVNFGGGFVSEDPMAQIYAGIHYALARYGTNMGAVIGHGHGYDNGGILKPGITLAVNGTGRDEYVTRTPPGGGNTYNITVTAPAGTHPAQLGREVVKVIAEYERVNGAGWRS